MTQKEIFLKEQNNNTRIFLYVEGISRKAYLILDMGAFKSKRIIRESLIGSPILNCFICIPAENKVTISSEYRKLMM